MTEAKDEETFAKENKYQNFQSAVERSLKNFELSSQWTDLVSHLSTLHKVLLAYTQYPVVPVKYELNRRLSQCLHPKLPHGVHLKTIDVYCAIFDRIKSDGLSADLHLYSSGLFPLMSFANIRVRTRLLEVYEKYILPLGYKLVPALGGFVLGLLPGLEENSDHSNRILAIIERIWNEIGRTELLDALWHSIILASSFRTAALGLVSTRLQREQKYNKQIVEYDKPLSRIALEAALNDSNTYTQRTALDLLIVNYSFGKTRTLIFSDEHVTTLLCPALCVLLRKDQSLTRRVYCWLLGDGNNNSTEIVQESSDLSHQSYFDVHVKTHVISALRVLLTTKDFVSCLKIVQCLFDKSSICDSIKETIMLDMAWGLYKQSLVASGSKLEDTQNKIKRKKKISNKIGLLRAANLLFQTFGEDFVWEWLEQFLKQSCDQSSCHSNGTIDEEMTVPIALQVMLLLVKLLPPESYADHLSSLLTVLLNIILEHYSELMEECLLIESLAIIKSLLNLLHNQSLQKQSVSRSNSVIPNSNRDSSSSPDNTSSKELEQVTNGVGGANCDYTNIVGLANVVETYLLLFPKLIFDACKVKHFDQSYTKEWEGSREAIECCQSSCDLLVDFLSLPLSAGDLDVASGNHVTLPEWLNGLFSCCVVDCGIHGDDGISHHHMMLQAISIFCYLLEMSNTVIPRELRLYIFHQTKFCQLASRMLYGCLVDVKLQSNGSRLLHRLHTSVKPLAVCEMVVLEGFSKHQDAVKPYQCYAVICQYTPQCKTENSQPRPFLKAGLRMLEGLQSSSPTVRNFVQRWVEHTSRKGNVEVLLSPILALLNEIPVRRQQYKTLSSQCLSTCYQLTEVVDTKRACFALNILTSLLEVGGAGLVQHFVVTTKQQQQPQHNTLQDILSLLMAILLAEYSERMDLSEEELAAGLTVKCAVCNCLNELFINFIKVVRITKEDSNNSGLRFFLSLLFLCEVQKLLLLMLCELQEGLQLVDSSSHESEPLLHSLLQAIGKILIIEFLSVPDDSSINQKSSFSPNKLNSALQKKLFIDANCLCLQPLFYALIRDASKNGQFCFLDMTLKYLPYSNPTQLVPQLFNIISQLLRNSSVDSSTVHLLFAVTSLTRFVWQEDSTFVTYINLQPLLNHLDVLHFIPSLADQNILRYKFPTRSCDPEVQSSNGGAISRLFSSIWSQRKSRDDDLMCSPLQEAVLEQMPRLYGTLASLWIRKDESRKLAWCSMNESAIFEDIKLLMHELLLSPLITLPEAFMSTIAEMWMNWSSDATEDRRTNFITLLHTVKLVELCDLLDYIKKTLLLLRQMENSDAGAVRQKYLLHFLYKYLSSPHQSAEVLDQCYSVMLTFLKDCDQLLSHPESICLLTSILHVLVCRTTSPTEKKTRRELQETVYLLCVSLSGAAGVATSQGYVWLQRNTAISVPHLLPSSSASSTPSSPRSPTRSSSPNLFKDDETASSFPTKREGSVEIPNMSSSTATSKLPIHHQLQMPTIQALAVLSNVLSQFVDYVYVEKEKDKIVSLLSAVLYHVWPHLNDYSIEHQLCYEHSLSLLTSLTEFTVARKSWKTETVGLFLHPNFFNMPSSCIDSWLTIIDNLMAQDRSTMKQFLSQIRPISVPLMTTEQLIKLAGLIKRLAFVLFAGEVDQYEDLLPDMQEKLLEGLRSPVTSAQVLLCYHVMLLRFSSKQLQQIWPTITSQSAKICHSLFKDLQQLTGIQSATTHKEGLQYASYKPPSLLQCSVYINACHLVHTMLTIPMEQLPQFQHVRWYYEGTTSSDDVDESVLNGTGGLCEKLNVESVTPKSLATKLREIKSIIKRISNSLSSHRFSKSTSEHSHEIEETLKSLFLST